MEQIAFFVLALLVVASALSVITNRNPVTCAVSLAFNLVAIAGLYMLLDAQFLGLMQVIVYAGAIMVLFLFVIMYLNLGHDPEHGATILLRRLIGWIAGALVVLQGAMLFAGRWALGPTSTEAPPLGGNTQALGQLLYSRFLFPFEITSLVLLVAMVGAIVISKGRSTRTPDPIPHAPHAGLQAVLRPGDTVTPPTPPGGGEA